jgi:hypothetical protein
MAGAAQSDQTPKEATMKIGRTRSFIAAAGSVSSQHDYLNNVESARSAAAQAAM